jgi:hypothetical protein
VNLKSIFEALSQQEDRSDITLPSQRPPTYENMKGFAQGSASGTLGALGNVEPIINALMSAKGGFISPEANKGDNFPDTYDMADKLGFDKEAAGFEDGTWFSSDPFGKIAKGVGLAMPFIGKVGKGKPVSKWGAEAMGYKSDIAEGAVTKKPIYEMSRTVEDVGTPIEQRTMHPEELLNQILVPLLGDRSDAGKLLTHVGDLELARAVELLGGHGFMRYNPDMLWASNSGAAKMINNRAKVGLDYGIPTSGIYMPMKHKPSNFNTMTTDVIYEQIAAGNHSKRMIKKFDDKMKETRPEWKGLADPMVRAQLHSNGALRHEFQRVNNLQDFQKYGFPDANEARFATTDPDLMHYGNVPLHQGGQAVGRFSGQTIRNPKVPHPTYDTNIGGSYTGSMPESMPREILFPEWYNARREGGFSLGTDAGSFNRVKPTQFASQEWLDGVMKYLERNNR